MLHHSSRRHPPRRCNPARSQTCPLKNAQASNAQRTRFSPPHPNNPTLLPAAAQLGFILAAARRLRLTGVALKEQASRTKEIEL